MLKRGGSLLITAVLSLCLLGTSHAAQAHARSGTKTGAVAILSPDHGQTWPGAVLRDYSWTLDHGKILTLVVTYSNEQFASHDDRGALNLDPAAIDDFLALG